jgi:cell division protein FtsB
MSLITEIRRRARAVTGPLLTIMVAGYFAYHAVQGDRGLIAWWQITQQIKQAEATERQVHAERAKLEHRVALLSSEHLDPDMLDERARIMLDLARPDEVVILNPGGAARDAAHPGAGSGAPALPPSR